MHKKITSFIIYYHTEKYFSSLCDFLRKNYFISFLYDLIFVTPKHFLSTVRSLFFKQKIP